MTLVPRGDTDGPSWPDHTGFRSCPRAGGETRHNPEPSHREPTLSSDLTQRLYAEPMNTDIDVQKRDTSRSRATENPHYRQI
ncbi:Hypp8926 [Branchiostoma lanceolatum]|uniref:Hypp8926 protein n=1 Tax=Branchiostoma lanceolatum TaxID=7740 RepID=A0A8J9ZBV7_BRALA|nr:Hypp8926 [Branchiostoma lanceolatum]